MLLGTGLHVCVCGRGGGGCCGLKMLCVDVGCHEMRESNVHQSSPEPSTSIHIQYSMVNTNGSIVLFLLW